MLGERVDDEVADLLPRLLALGHELERDAPAAAVVVVERHAARDVRQETERACPVERAHPNPVNGADVAGVAGRLEVRAGRRDVADGGARLGVDPLDGRENSGRHPHAAPRLVHAARIKAGVI